jgi:glycosyltransferase involved in cell wall biosynthesis
MRAAIRRHDPDVVIGFMHSMFIPLTLSLIGLNKPLIASEHIVYQHYATRRRERALLRLLPIRTATVLCVSEQAKATYPQFLQRHMGVIPNPVTIKVEARADVIAPSHQRKVLLSVGRLDPQKDFSTLVDAFARIADLRPDWDLRIVGEGELRSNLEQKIAQLDLERRISLPGVTQNISGEYQRAQLFVVPSRYESFSLSTAEALAHGLPVVGFVDCPAIDHLVRSGENGVLVEPGNDRSVSLATALLPLMSDPELRQRMAASCQAVEENNFDEILNQWETLFTSQPR